MHTHDQFLKLSVGLNLGLVFASLFGFSILCVDYFALVLFAFVVLDVVSSVLRQEIGWEERNDMFCVE